MFSSTFVLLNISTVMFVLNITVLMYVCFKMFNFMVVNFPQFKKYTSLENSQTKMQRKKQNRTPKNSEITSKRYNMCNWNTRKENITEEHLK